MSAVRVFLEHFRGDLLPIYIGLAGVCGWLGMLTGIVALETGAGVPTSQRIISLSVVLSVTFGIVFPAGLPAAVVVGQWWRGEL